LKLSPAALTNKHLGEWFLPSGTATGNYPVQWPIRFMGGELPAADGAAQVTNMCRDSGKLKFRRGFALYEVLLGVAIFAVGVWRWTGSELS
jgi:hypothetical protein